MTWLLIAIAWIAWGYWEDQAQKNYFRRRFPQVPFRDRWLVGFAYAAPPISTLASLSVFGWGYWSSKVKPYRPFDRDFEA